MVFPLVCVLIIPIVFVVIIRGFYLIVFENGKIFQKKKHSKQVKTFIVLGSGGHTAEILRVVQNLNLKKYFPRVYVKAKSDFISSKKVEEIETNIEDFEIIEISRSREVKQSYLTSVFTTIQAFFESFSIIWKEKPELLLCNGPGTCIPLCLVAFILNALFLLDAKIIFIESYCRVKSFSLSGKILYFLANHIIVQWPKLSGKMDTQSLALKIQWNCLEDALEKYSPKELKFYLNQLLERLKNFYAINSGLSDTKKSKQDLEWVKNDMLTVEACIDRIWEMLNSGYWKDVSVDYRYIYSLCSVLKSLLLEILTTTELNQMKKLNILKKIMEQIDKGILLGAPLPNCTNLLTNMATQLNNLFINMNKGPIETSNSTKIDQESMCTNLFPGFSSVHYFTKPSLETFFCDIFKPKLPAILKGCIDHWQALTLWKNTHYLRNIAGNRTVPIEIGSRYTEDDWTQSLVTFTDFLNTHMTKKSEKIGYLAQHQLFDQIPELKKDFSIPDYCSFSDKEDNIDLPDINAWFGPEGTISPLHYDPKNNLLSQVFGYKRIILYCPEDTKNLYPYETRLLSNTAKVDPYNPNFEQYPEFQKANGYMCFLKPGDMLFIPPKWWHHVVSLSPSFSISFWWD